MKKRLLQTIVACCGVMVSIGACQAETVVETIEYSNTPAIQSGKMIEDSNVIVADDSQENVDVTTTRIGSNIVKEYRVSGRLIQTEVTPDVGIGTYIIENPTGDDLIREDYDSTERNRPHKWLLQQW